MIFRRSTRAIVSGRRPRAPASSAEITDGTSQPIPTSDGVTAPQEPSEGKLNLKESKILNVEKWPRWAVEAAIGCFVLALAAVFIFVCSIFSRPKNALPEIRDGQVIAAVQNDAALSGAAASGDIVRLYGTDGVPVPALQYVQVYQSAADSGLLVLLDDMQAAAMARQQNISAVLVVRGDPERAAALLELQERINDPQITLTLQPTAILSPGTDLALEVSAAIDPVEAELPPIQWASSDNTVAIVDDGIVTAMGVGQATVTASCGGAEAVCRVTVEIPLAGILLDKPEVVMAAGETVPLSAAADPADATGFTVTWSTSDPDVAAVAEDGSVTAVAPGTATVTAACGNITASCTVMVGVHAEVAQLDKQAMALTVGQSAQLTASIYPSSNVIDAGAFESSDPAIVTVAEDGTVTGIAPGTATITFRCGEATASCTVTVTAAPAQ